MDVNSMFEMAVENKFLLDIALLLLAATIGGWLANLIKMPEVLGQILAGIIIGPTVFGWARGDGELIYVISELGVIFLMFLAGLETDLKELKSAGKGATSIAAGGVLVPLILGTFIPLLFFDKYLPTGDAHSKLMSAIYIGTILTATSVSISVSVLRDIGQLGSRQGISILGGAIIDDVFGIILLAVVTGMLNPVGNISIGMLILKMVIFFILSIIIGIILSKLITKYAVQAAWKDKIVGLAIISCFLFSFVAEMFSVAAITGAYIAGVIFSATPYRNKIVRKIQDVAYSLFTPIFFVSIGLKAEITADIINYIGYALIIVIIAMVGKILGCGMGAKLSGFNNKKSLQIGVGMIARAEVALIVATQGINRGFIKKETFTSIVLLVVISTMITPPLLKLLFKNEKVSTDN